MQYHSMWEFIFPRKGADFLRQHKIVGLYKFDKWRHIKWVICFIWISLCVHSLPMSYKFLEMRIWHAYCLSKIENQVRAERDNPQIDNTYGDSLTVQSQGCSIFLLFKAPKVTCFINLTLVCASHVIVKPHWHRKYKLLPLFWNTWLWNECIRHVFVV